MTQYAQIKDDKFDKLVTKRKGGYIFADGTSTGSIECFTDEQLADKGILPYEESRDVLNNRTQKFAPISYSVQDGKVVGTYSAIDKTQEEIDSDFKNALDNLRAKRNRLLQETEYAEYSRKLTEQQRSDLLSYRDALFNITDNVVDPTGTDSPKIGGVYPDDAIFPDKPL